MLGTCGAKTGKARPCAGRAFGFGGAKEDRTPDLYNAIVALSQLSYGPETFSTPAWDAVCREAENMDFAIPGQD